MSNQISHHMEIASRHQLQTKGTARAYLKSKHHITLRHHMRHLNKFIKPLPPVQKKLEHPPTAESLDNHYGISTDYSPYGPQPTLFKRLKTIFINNRVSSVDTDNVIIHTKSGCEVEYMPNFELCFKLRACHLCTASPYCGWCPLTNKCLPGNMTTPLCSYMCPRGWNFRRENCFDKVFAVGSMTNICKAEGLVPVELAPEKLRITTQIEFPAIVHTPVVLGEVQRLKTMEKFANGQQSVTNITETRPILGEMIRKLNVLYHHKQIVDVNSGKKLDVDDALKYHGFNLN